MRIDFYAGLHDFLCVCERVHVGSNAKKLKWCMSILNLVS